MNTQEKSQYKSGAGNTIELYTTEKGVVTHNLNNNDVNALLNGSEDPMINFNLDGALNLIGWKS